MTNPLEKYNKPTILLFVKAPYPGKVKTRLAETIGEVAALEAFKLLVIKQLERIPPGFELEVHYTPDEAESEIAAWLGEDLKRFRQEEGDLGDRLTAATKAAFARGAASVYCIGGDCPGLDASHFLLAEEQLRQGADLCFGPTEDGGYYLLAMAAPHPDIFREIPWSTQHTLATSILRAEEHGLNVHLLEELYDIDTEFDLNRATQEGLL
ncbi:MAG: TIGR04282 family arsenosugar biosynthesis glycosyltransferase [Verrucomicrobiota bacterium]